jgi:1-acyl-sn-glycerol-3-phosphate acyltransferase
MTFSTLRAIRNAITLLGWLGVWILPYLILLMCNASKRYDVLRIFYKGCLKILNIRLSTYGRTHCETILYIANHASYLDIFVLGTLLSDSVFVAKHEVSNWPLFGFLARIANTVFIRRNARLAQHQNTILGQHFERGTSLILFPEGTSTNGAYVHPFKSSLFASLDNLKCEPWAQPVTVVYGRTNDGDMMNQDERENFTWFGDMTLAPHLWRVLGLQGCEVEVVFSTPVNRKAFTDRKHMATTCFDIVNSTLNVALEQTSDSLPCAAE